jgi:hypothetical protein
MLDTIAGLVNADARLVQRGRFVDTTFMIVIDNDYTSLRIREGQVTRVTPGPFITPDYSFCLRAPRDVWEKFWQPLPPRGFTDIFALVKQKLMQVEGDLHPFMANLLYFKDVIAAPRKSATRRAAR